MLNGRGGNISYGVFHIGLSQLGGAAACLVPRLIQREAGSGRSMGDVALLLLGRDTKLFLVQRRIGLGLTGLHIRGVK